MGSPRAVIRFGMALLLIAAALSAVGCGARVRAATSPQSSADVTPAVGPPKQDAATLGLSSGTEAQLAGTAAAASASSKEPDGSSLTSSEADALDAELTAIQSELDRVSLPDDSDFDSLGLGLK